MHHGEQLTFELDTLQACEGQNNGEGYWWQRSVRCQWKHHFSSLVLLFICLYLFLLMFRNCDQCTWSISWTAGRDHISFPLYSMSQGVGNISLTLDMDTMILFTGWLNLCINYLPHIAEQIILSERKHSGLCCVLRRILSHIEFKPQLCVCICILVDLEMSKFEFEFL